MTEELKNHIEANLDRYNTWINDNAILQVGSDYISPLVKPFLEEFPTVNLNGSCREYIIDMLRWAVIQYKKLYQQRRNKYDPSTNYRLNSRAQ